MPLVIFIDLEATGFTAPIRITQLSAVACYLDVNLTEINRFSEYVNPGRPIEPAAELVSGLTWSSLEGCPPIQDVLLRFASFLKTLPDTNCIYLVAHGGKRFDFPVLQQELQRTANSLQLPYHIMIDSLTLFRAYAREFGGGWPAYGLDAVSERLLGWSRTSCHDALADSLILRACCAQITYFFAAFVTSPSIKGWPGIWLP